MDNVEQIKKEENKEKNINNLVNLMNDDENKSSFVKKDNEKNQDILYIPPHKNLCSVITKSFDINNEIKLNLSKKDIDAMTKMGIITHSFDSNWIPQINYQENISNEDLNNYTEFKNDINKKPSKSGMKKNSSLGSMGTTVAGTQKNFIMNNNE